MTCFKTTELACGADWDPAAAGGSGAGGPDGSGRGSGNGSGGSSAGPWSARPQAWQRSASFLLKDPQFGHGWSFGMGLLQADDRRHVEPPVLEDERGESRLVVRAAHLRHADPPLDLDVRVRRRNSIQGFVALFPISFWIVPTSRMWTSPRTASTSRPMADI